MKYKIYKSRLQYNQYNELYFEIEKNNLEEVFKHLKEKENLNPYYTTIMDENNNIVYNKFLKFNINNPNPERKL